MFRPLVLLLLAGTLLGDPAATRSRAAVEDGPTFESAPVGEAHWIAAPGVQPLEARPGREGGTPLPQLAARPGRSADATVLDGATTAPEASGSDASDLHLVHCGATAWCTATPPPHVPR